MASSAINGLTGSPVTGDGGLPNGLGRQEFLQLLVTQLQNQDPLNPIQDREFIAQMAQLSTLEATNNLAAQVQQMVAGQQQLGALQLVGRKVEYLQEDGSTAQGMVNAVRLDGPVPVLQVDKAEVPVGWVQTVL
jgi:flagellar basal-body rod modification protein FlgD